MLLLVELTHADPAYTVLASGLRVAVEPTPGAPHVTATMVLPVGSAIDGREDTAHLVEHLWFQARPGGTRVWDTLDGLGAHRQGMTFEDHTVYLTSAPVDAFTSMLALEAARLRDPLAGVTAETVASEREVVAREAELRGGRSRNMLFGTIDAVLLPEDHPYNQPSVVAVSDLPGLAAFTSAWYRPKGATLLLGGDLPADIGEQLAAAFGVPLPTFTFELAPLPTSPAPLVHPRTTRTRWVSGLGDDPEVAAAWTIPGGWDPQQAAISATAVRLAEGLFVGPATGGVGESTCAERTRALASVIVCSARAERWTWPDVTLATMLRELDTALFADLRAAVVRLGVGRAWAIAVLRDQQRRAAQADDEALTDTALWLHYGGSAGSVSARVAAIQRTKPAEIVAFLRRWVAEERAARLVLVPPVDEVSLDEAPVAPEQRPSVSQALEPYPLPDLPWTLSTNKFGMKVYTLPVPWMTGFLAAMNLHAGRWYQPAPGVDALALPATLEPGPENVGLGALVSDGGVAMSFRDVFGVAAAASGPPDAIDAAFTWFQTGLALETFTWAPRDRLPPQSRVERAWEEALAHLFPGHPAYAPMRKRPSRQDATTWFARVHQPTNAQVYVVGNVGTSGEYSTGRGFTWMMPADTPEAPAPAPPPPDPSERSIALARIDAAITTVYLRCQLAVGGVAVDPAREVASTLLSRRLWRDLREGGGLVYTPMVGAARLPGGANLLAVTLPTRPGSGGVVLDHLLSSLATLGDAPQAEIDAAIAHTLDDTRHRYSAAESLLFALREHVEGGGTPETWAALGATIRAVDTAAIRAVMERCVGHETVFVTGPEAALEPLRDRPGTRWIR